LGARASSTIVQKETYLEEGKKKGGKRPHWATSGEEHSLDAEKEERLVRKQTVSEIPYRREEGER